MKFKWKRLTAAAMAAVLTFSTGTCSVYASAVGETEEESITEEAAETTEAEAAKTEEAAVEEEAVQAEAALAEEAEEISEAEEPAEAQEDEISYVYVEQPYLETPQKQNIVFSFAEADLDIQEAKLVVKNETNGTTEELKAAEIQEHVILFSKEYKEGKGIYRLESLIYTVGEDETEKKISLAERELGELTYGVNTELGVSYVDQNGTVEGNPEVDAQIVKMDENGKALSGATFEAAVKKADPSFADEILKYKEGRKKARQDMVVVLDPGHDSRHHGASAFGLMEEDLTLKIAKFCKEELEEYAGVKVYLTRESGSCPYPGSDSVTDNRSRVERAAELGADIYVSLHLNSSPASSAAGAEVFYPNSNYVNWIGKEGKDLATKISQELAALGLNNRGVSIRSSEDGTKYPDGSLADYYAVIRKSKELGFPGIIVEHAFLTNSGDVAGYLNSDEKLKKLGIADATGIANYLELKKAPEVTFSYESMVIENIDHVGGNFDIVLKGITPAANAAKVQFLVWNEKNGQDDARVYEGRPTANGEMRWRISIANHGNGRGKYLAQAFVFDQKGREQHLANATGIVSLYIDMPETYGWRYQAVEFVTENNIMNGISGTGKFAPDDMLTRAMFATITYRMAGSPAATHNGKFPDVPGGNYFSAPISWANSVGIITGHSNTGLFGTYENITREDMVTILYRYAAYKGVDLSGKDSLSKFPDADQISGYAKPALQWAVANGIITGRSTTGTLDPKGNATRVECAAIIQRFMTKYK